MRSQGCKPGTAECVIPEKCSERLHYSLWSFFNGKEIKEIFEFVKNAVGKKPPTWSATYPQEENGNLYVEVEEGEGIDLELPETQFDPNDIF